MNFPMSREELNCAYFINVAQAFSMGFCDLGLTILFGFLFVLGIVFHDLFWGLFGFIFFVPYLFFFIHHAKLYFNKPTDAEIDAQALALYSRLRAEALPKLGLKENDVNVVKPVELWGYSFDKPNLVKDVSLPLSDLRGKDGVWRSPEVVLLALYFSRDTIHSYCRGESLVSNSSCESTDELFYQDIVSVKIESAESPIYNRKTGKIIPEEKAHFYSIILRDVGGGTISCPVRYVAEAEKAVETIRALLMRRKVHGSFQKRKKCHDPLHENV